MEEGDLPRETGGEAGEGLGRERDLRHKHENRAAKLQAFLGGAQVHLGLAAAGYPEQQEFARRPGIASCSTERRCDGPDSPGLGGGRVERHACLELVLRKRVPVHPDFIDAQQARLPGPVDA